MEVEVHAFLGYLLVVGARGGRQLLVGSQLRIMSSWSIGRMADI
jgi:hypothetical protein